MKEVGGARALIVCGRTVASGEMLARVTEKLGTNCAGVFTGVENHTTLETVIGGAEFAARNDIDLLVSVGGGSAIDTAKCIALMLACEGQWEPFVINYREKGSLDREFLAPGVIPHIAIPTTAGSASEVLPSAGCRDVGTGRKLGFWDRELLPKVAVLDPEMAVFAGPTLTAASGMTAVARCIESLYSGRRHPLSTGLALHGLRLLHTALPQSIAEPENLKARGDCQLGCLLSGIAAINAMVSLVHASGHLFGGRYGLQHGIAHSILLAPAMRLLLPSIGDERYLMAQALGVETKGMTADVAAEEAINSLDALVKKLPLPPRLRDVGVAEVDLPSLAEACMHEYMITYLPHPVSEDEVLSLFRSAY
jgi:alcohol dehydrogenase class IV